MPRSSWKVTRWSSPGAKVGSIKTIELAPNGGALVTFTVNEDFAPLKRGTTATVRSPSLSQIAGRQVQLTLPAEGDSQQSYPGGAEAAGEEIEDGGTLSQSETVSAVDLDELFNTLDARTIRNLKKVIKGFEISYDGVGKQANKGFRYLNPFLSTSRRVFGELNRDEQALQALIVDGSKLSGALAERAPDLTALIGNLNRFQGALANEKENLATAVREFPDFMREANTTFVNLRATLDDVDPLVDASKPVAVRLRPFFTEFRAAAAGLVPTVEDLDQLILRPGHGQRPRRSEPPPARGHRGRARQRLADLRRKPQRPRRSRLGRRRRLHPGRLRRAGLRAQGRPARGRLPAGVHAGARPHGSTTSPTPASTTRMAAWAASS